MKLLGSCSFRSVHQSYIGAWCSHLPPLQRCYTIFLAYFSFPSFSHCFLYTSFPPPFAHEVILLCSLYLTPHSGPTCSPSALEISPTFMTEYVLFWRVQRVLSLQHCISYTAVLFWQRCADILLSQVLVCGYPTGGDAISLSSGVVSRIEFQRYSHDGSMQVWRVATSDWMHFASQTFISDIELTTTRRVLEKERKKERVCLCMCMRVRKKEREGERKKERERERERKRKKEIKK